MMDNGTYYQGQRVPKSSILDNWDMKKCYTRVEVLVIDCCEGCSGTGECACSGAVCRECGGSGQTERVISRYIDTGYIRLLEIAKG